MVLADGEAVLFRPLLGVTRSSLEMYAESRCLSWIDDESNASLNFDRNYLRHEIIPPCKIVGPTCCRRGFRWLIALGVSKS